MIRIQEEQNCRGHNIYRGIHRVQVVLALILHFEFQALFDEPEANVILALILQNLILCVFRFFKEVYFLQVA